MSLRDEVKEAMVAAAERRGCPSLAHDIRAEKTTVLPRTAAEDVAKAVLSVCDEYKEMEMQASPHDGTYLRIVGNRYWSPREPSFLIYRKKPKPEPTALEAMEEAAGLLADIAERSGVLDAWPRVRDILAGAIAREK